MVNCDVKGVLQRYEDIVRECTNSDGSKDVDRINRMLHDNFTPDEKTLLVNLLMVMRK